MQTPQIVRKINHLVYMDDFKLFGKMFLKKDLETLIQGVRV